MSASSRLLASSLFAALASPGIAHAEGDWITAVGDRIDLDLSGNWTRVYPDGSGGWTLFITGGGNYHYIPMNANYELLSSRNQLTDADIRLVDHQIAQCPDGSWFHVASAEVNEPDDTAYVFRYDSNFNLTCELELAYGHPIHRFNDAPILCTPWYGATPAHSDTSDTQMPIYLIEDDCSINREEDHPATPPIPGSSLVYDADMNEIWGVRATGNDQFLQWVPFTLLLDAAALPVSEQFYLPPFYMTAFPQAMIQVGDYRVLAHLGMNPDVNYGADNGDIWIQVIDRDHQAVQSVRLTEYGNSQGANRPWLSWQDDKIVVVYDDSLQPRLVELTIDRDAFGLTPGSDDGGGTDGSGAGGGTGGSDDGGGTGGSGDDGGTGSGDGGGTGGGDDGGIVEEGNKSPVSIAGPDRGVPPGTRLLLDGTSSVDPEGDLMAFQWSFLRVPPGSTLTDADIEGATTARAFVTPDIVGLYELQLVADDGTTTDRDSVLLVVSDPSGGGCATRAGGALGGVGLLLGLGLVAARRRED